MASVKKEERAVRPDVDLNTLLEAVHNKVRAACVRGGLGARVHVCAWPLRPTCTDALSEAADSCAGVQ